jgi:hypothetical protein
MSRILDLFLKDSRFGNGGGSVVILRRMSERHVTPILNVSDIGVSFAWFEKWGWKKLWDWGTPPSFGAVGSGEAEIFLCLGGQGGRGKGANAFTLGRMELKLRIRARGCRFGWTTLTRSIDNALPLGWMSLSRRPTCRGGFARCMFGIRTGMYFG